VTWTLLGGIAALLALCALLTAAATAAFHVSPSRLRTLQEEGFTGAESLVQLRAEPHRTRASIRLVVTTLAVTAAVLATLLGVEQAGLPGGALVAAGVLLLLLSVGDVLPRLLAARAPVKLALASAPLLIRLARGVQAVARPLVQLEGALGNEDEPELSREERELREIQEIGEEAGILEEAENLLVERAFRLDELTTWDVLTPRVDIFAYDGTQTLGEIIDGLRDVPFSRVPVYEGSVDEITGILYIRQAYQAWVEGRTEVPLAELAREPFFVPGSLSLGQLLQDFQARRIHMGIVADEFGGVEGLVTLEDVLEELVGEIVDETDVDEEEIVRVSRNQMVADAGVDLREVNHAFNLSMPVAEHRSLNGYILEEMGYVPTAGETLERKGVRIEIMEATDTQVIRARLTRLPGGPSTSTRPEEP